jgi:hypothetical protein
MVMKITALVKLLESYPGSNLFRVPPAATRCSFTQYTAGGPFRWVENGFQKCSDFYASLSEEGQEEQQLKDAAWWEFGLSLFPSASL